MFEKKGAEERGPMRPGDVALLDVETLCDILAQDLDARVVEAAGFLGGEVRQLVAKSTAGPGDCCRGVSVFYRPSPRAKNPPHVDDDCLANMVYPNRYRSYSVNQAVDGGKQPAMQWVDVAFEQV